MAKSPKTNYRTERNALNNAIARCTITTHAQYADYGGRGITVHDSFLGENGFANFLKAVGPKPSPELTLDRVSNDKGYEPGNLAWTSRSVQQRNRRKSRVRVKDLGWGLGAHTIMRSDGRPTTIYSPRVPLDEQVRTLRDWAKILGISERTLQQRLQRGKSPKDALVPVLFHPNGSIRSKPTIH